MARIRIEDLPPEENLTKEEKEAIYGAGWRSYRPEFEDLEARLVMDSGLSSIMAANNAMVDELIRHVSTGAGRATLPNSQGPGDWVSPNMHDSDQFFTEYVATDPNAAAPGQVKITFNVADLQNEQGSDFYYCVVGYRPQAGNPHAGDMSQPIYLDADGTYHALTANSTVPTIKLTGSIILPAEAILSGRLYVMEGKNDIKTDGGGQPKLPSPGNRNTSGFEYDHLEFSRAMDQGNLSFGVNLTQVDAFGMPMNFTVTDKDGNSQSMGTVNGLTRKEVFEKFADFAKGTGYQDCLQQDMAFTRIINPSHLIELDSNSFKGYFDNQLSKLFSSGTTLKLKGIVDAGHPPTWDAKLGKMVGGQNYIGTYNQGTDQLEFYKEGDANKTIVARVDNPLHKDPTGTNRGAAYQVFANVGVFAQGSDVEKNLENQVVSALNRGVALEKTNFGDPTGGDAWLNSKMYYQSNGSNGGVWNKYAEFLHRTDINIGGKAYGFAYDDQAGQSTYIETDPSKGMSVALGKWGSTPVNPQVVDKALSDVINQWNNTDLVKAHNTSGTYLANLTVADKAAPDGHKDGWAKPMGKFSADLKTFTARFCLNNGGMVDVTYTVTGTEQSGLNLKFSTIVVAKDHYLSPGEATSTDFNTANGLQNLMKKELAK